ncbi:MAG: hypothetical protein ACKVU0_05025 [Saprospiraceae bacterium]
MRQKILLFIPLFFLLTGHCVAQDGPSRELSGRVVEIRDGEAFGVPNITVNIVGFDFDVTKANGSFSLQLPPDRDHVSIELENTSSKIVSPYSGVVNLPHDHDLQIVICGEENRRLREKLNQVNRNIGKLEKERKLNTRQLQAMRQTLLDTIIHFEMVIGRLNQRLEKSEAENTALSEELAARDERIRTLEESERNLVEALSEALKVKFLKQKEIFEGISADLITYTDRLKDLRDRCTPKQLSYPFHSPEASAQLGNKIKEYNEIRHVIVKNHHANKLIVREYWAEIEVADLLESTYDYLLKNVHEDIVLPIDSRVFGPVREVATNQTGPGKAQKSAQAAAKALLPELNASIQELEKRTQQTILMMSTNI